MSEIVMKAISKKPEARHQTIDALSDELAKCRPPHDPKPSEERVAAYMNDLFGPAKTPLPVRRSSAPPPLFRKDLTGF